MVAVADADAAALQHLTDGLQEDMMIAMLNVMQAAAAACADVCTQRLLSLQKELAAEKVSLPSGEAIHADARSGGGDQRLTIHHTMTSLDGSDGQGLPVAMHHTMTGLDGGGGEEPLTTMHHTLTSLDRGNGEDSLEAMFEGRGFSPQGDGEPLAEEWGSDQMPEAAGYGEPPMEEQQPRGRRRTVSASIPKVALRYVASPSAVILLDEASDSESLESDAGRSPLEIDPIFLIDPSRGAESDEPPTGVPLTRLVPELAPSEALTRISDSLDVADEEEPPTEVPPARQVSAAATSEAPTRIGNSPDVADAGEPRTEVPLARQVAVAAPNEVPTWIGNSLDVADAEEPPTEMPPARQVPAAARSEAPTRASDSLDVADEDEPPTEEPPARQVPVAAPSEALMRTNDAAAALAEPKESSYAEIRGREIVRDAFRKATEPAEATYAEIRACEIVRDAFQPESRAVLARSAARQEVLSEVTADIHVSGDPALQAACVAAAGRLLRCCYARGSTDCIREALRRAEPAEPQAASPAAELHTEPTYAEIRAHEIVRDAFQKESRAALARPASCEEVLRSPTAELHSEPDYAEVRAREIVCGAFRKALQAEAMHVGCEPALQHSVASRARKRSSIASRHSMQAPVRLLPDESEADALSPDEALFAMCQLTAETEGGIFDMDLPEAIHAGFDPAVQAACVAAASRLLCCHYARCSGEVVPIRRGGSSSRSSSSSSSSSTTSQATNSPRTSPRSGSAQQQYSREDSATASHVDPAIEIQIMQLSDHDDVDQKVSSALEAKGIDPDSLGQPNCVVTNAQGEAVPMTEGGNFGDGGLIGGDYPLTYKMTWSGRGDPLPAKGETPPEECDMDAPDDLLDFLAKMPDESPCGGTLVEVSWDEAAAPEARTEDLFEL